MACVKRSLISACRKGGQVTMDPADRNRRVQNNACNKTLQLTPLATQGHFPGKSSEHVWQYTDSRQESPERKRGRQATLSRSALWMRYSVDSILSAGAKEFKLDPLHDCAVPGGLKQRENIVSLQNQELLLLQIWNMQSKVYNHCCTWHYWPAWHGTLIT